MKTISHILVKVLTAIGIGLSAFVMAYAQEKLPYPLNEREVIDNRIDVYAQRSIVRLSKGTLEQRFMSRYLFKAVKYGALGGIYLVDTQVPAMRARALGKNWWTLLEGRPAICLKEPAGERPIIVFGKQVSTQPAALDVALASAFEECGFRRVKVIVKKGAMGSSIPCGEAFVSLASEPVGVLVDPPCHTTSLGVCNFGVPPQIYRFQVTCDGMPTSPPDIYRPIAPGEGIQIEEFHFEIPIYQ